MNLSWDLEKALRTQPAELTEKHRAKIDEVYPGFLDSLEDLQRDVSLFNDAFQYLANSKVEGIRPEGQVWLLLLKALRPRANREDTPPCRHRRGIKLKRCGPCRVTWYVKWIAS